MKVMLVSNDAVLGGAALSMLDMLKEIKRYLDAIVVIPAHGNLEKRLIDLHIKYYIVPFSRDYKLICGGQNSDNEDLYVDNYAASKLVADIAKKEKVAIIHTNSSTGNVGIVAALMLGIPHVWHIRELMEEDFSATFYDKEYKRQLFALSDCQIAISKCVREKYAEKFSVNSITIYNGIDMAKCDCLSQREYLDWNIMIAGNLSENKGQFDAIKAVRLLKDDGIVNVRLYIIGNGVEKLKWCIKKYIEDNSLQENVFMIPFCDNLGEYRRKCDISITGSKMEALGRVTVEAMASGQLVIGTRSGGTLELIGKDEKRGLLYSFGDAKSLADAIKRIIEMDSFNKIKIAKDAQDFALDVFDVGRYSKKILELYNRVIDTYKATDEKKELLRQLEEKYVSLQANKSEAHIVDTSNASKIEEMWNQLGNPGISISSFFSKNGVSKVAIYGMGHFGCRLFDELETGGITIPYVMDQKPGKLAEVAKVKTEKDILDDADIIVVTVSGNETEIIESLREMTSVKVIGITEILTMMSKRFS